MSLLDEIGEFQGDTLYVAGHPLKDGEEESLPAKTVIRVSRVSFKDASAKVPHATFRVDGEILASEADAHSGQLGFTATVQLNFNYPESDLPKMRQMLAIMSVSAGIRKSFQEAMASFPKAVRAPGMSDAAFKAEKDRCAKVAKDFTLELVGEGQPLTGALVTVVATTALTKKARKPFTKQAIALPTEADLVKAGLIPAGTSVAA